MISANIKTDVKQEVKELVAVSYTFFTKLPSQNLKCNVKQVCIFHLILAGNSIQLDFYLTILKGKNCVFLISVHE